MSVATNASESTKASASRTMSVTIKASASTTARAIIIPACRVHLTHKSTFNTQVEQHPEAQ